MSNPRIFLVDNDPYVLETVAQILKPTFEIVGRCSDGQALLEAATKSNPDVIVMDISMPVLNGIAAANKLKELGLSSRIVFLTVHEDRDFIDTCLATGALGYVTKPRMDLDLVTAIQDALKGRTFVSEIS